MYKLVTFSLNNVLLRVSRGVGAQYADVASKYKINVEPKKMENIFWSNRRKYEQAFQAFGKEKGLKPEDWWHMLVKDCFKESSHGDLDINEKVARHLYLHFGTHRPWEVIKETAELVDTLRSRNLKVGVVSSMDSRLFTVLASFDLYDSFDFILTPDKVGYEKINPKMFEEALKYGKAESTLHVGKDVDDYQGAKGAGIKCLLVRENNDLPPGVNRNDVVPDISQISSFLES